MWKLSRGLMLTLSLLPTTLWAQQKDSQAEYKAELQKLEASYRQAQNKYYEPYSKAKSDAEAAKIHLDPKLDPSRSFLPRYQDLAKRAQGTEAGLDALMTARKLAFQTDQPKIAHEDDNRLLTVYGRSPLLEKAAQQLRYVQTEQEQKDNGPLLRRLLQTTPQHSAKAAITFILASQLVEGHPKDTTEVRQLFASLKQDFSDTPYAKQIDPYLFELDHLQIGMAAPDFEATDQDGSSYKLSDYRGKVVVLDFWGFW